MQHRDALERVLELIDAAAATEGAERSRLIDHALAEYRRIRRLPDMPLRLHIEQEEG